MGLPFRIPGINDSLRAFTGILFGNLEEGISKADTFRELGGSEKLGISRSTFYRSYEAISEIKEGWDRMKFVSRGREIKSGYVDTSTILTDYEGKMRNMVTIIKLDVQNTVTGETFSVFRHVYHDRNRLRRSLEKEAWEDFTQGAMTRMRLVDARPVGGARFNIEVGEEW